MPVLPTASELLAAVRESRLLPDDVVAPYRVGMEVAHERPESALARMVADRLLTKYQAKRLLSGRSKGFFLTGKYKLLDHLGSGGMGHVYLCEHLLLQRLVAVKVLQVAQSNANTGVVERFLREARAVAQFDHPNITRVFDMDRAGTVPFMVMEYVDGNDLHSIVSSHGPMPVARASNCVYQAANGLAHAHQAGLVHRDIKPGNLLLDRAGVVKILDLGLARFFANVSRNDNLTATYDERRIIGTADYMAPEQTLDSSAVDIRADLYSLGCTFYFLLTGHAPFEAGTVTQKLLWHQLRQPPPIASFRQDVPDDIRNVVERLMAKDPNDRFQKPSEVIEALSAYAQPGHLPEAKEMPPIAAAEYRLGLTNLPVPRGDTALTMQVLPDPQSTIETHGSAKSSTEPHPVSSQPQPPSAQPLLTAPPNRRRWLVFAAVQVVVLILGVFASWLINRLSRAETKTPPVRVTTTAPGEPLFTLVGGGSTFVGKAMAEWKALYEPITQGRIEYVGGGSGGGVTGLLERKFDFACTDAYLSPAQLDEAKRAGMDLVHIPLVHGAVVPTYNLGEHSHGIRFTGPVLADIYLGTIRKWNDPRLQQDNPQAKLPDQAITVVYRSDSSGSTNIWTDFLRKTSPRWRAEMGDFATNSPKAWKVGIGAKGSEGVAAIVNATPGAIGYVELTHALGQKQLSIGHVKNRDGFYVQPTLASVRSAAAELRDRIPTDLRFTLTDGPGAATYPIAGTTWAVFDAANPDADKKHRIVEFLDWVTHAGQAPVTLIYYAPLPDELVQYLEGKLQRLRAPR